MTKTNFRGVRSKAKICSGEKNNFSLLLLGLLAGALQIRLTKDRLTKGKQKFINCIVPIRGSIFSDGELKGVVGTWVYTAS